MYVVGHFQISFKFRDIHIVCVLKVLNQYYLLLKSVVYVGFLLSFIVKDIRCLRNVLVGGIEYL